MRLPIALIALLAMLSAAHAAERPLTGTYRIGGKTLIDPPSDEPRDTHVYFELTGAAAKDLYDAMKSRAKQDACAEPGELVKSQGEFQCTRGPGGKAYRCTFGVDVANRKLARATVC